MLGAPDTSDELEWLNRHDVDGDAERDAIQASTALRDATHRLELARLEGEVSGLNLALETRTTIGIAMGMLMATSRVSADQAFDMLRSASQRSNRKLSAIAAEMIADHAARISDAQLGGAPARLRAEALTSRIRQTRAPDAAGSTGCGHDVAASW